ncbi:MAG: tyrosine-type recombinase/integrase [Candidatus Hadarchaeota archaeon]
MPTVDFASKVEREVRKIEEDQDLCEENRRLLLEFKRDLKLDGLSDAWIHKLLTHVRTMGERLGSGFEEATRDDLKDVVEWVQCRDISPATKRDYKEALKRFYKWLNGGEHPEKTRWINTTRKRRNHKLPEKLLTEDDVQALMEAAENPRDRAFVSLLWETGARIGELIDLEVGSFEDHEHGLKISIEGKTGMRRLPLISSVPHLNNWLTNHPKGDDPEAPVWCRLKGSKAGEKVGYRNLRKVLDRLADAAGVDKPSNPHHFRHSRATYLASRFTESQLCEWFGWVQGSDRPATYVHMSGREIDSDYARLHGIKDDREPGESGLAPEGCPRCGEMNGPEASFCRKCGLALDEKAAMESEEKEAIGELVAEKAEEVEVNGSLDDLLLVAAKRGLRDILGDEKLERLTKDRHG